MQIRFVAQQGMTKTEIARRFGVSRQSVCAQHATELKHLGVLTLTLALGACDPASPPADTPSRAPVTEMSAEALLAELNPRGGAALVQAWAGDDPEAVAAFYMDDAVVVVYPEAVYRGRAKILSGYLRPLVATVSDLTPTLDQVVGGPERMTIIGRYTARISPPDQAPYQAAGVFSNTWVRQPDGSWKIRAGVASSPAPMTRVAGGTHRTRPGEAVRVVRFNVKPDARETFERFFWESLRPAAAKRQGVPIEDLDLGGFRLLIPSETSPQGLFTYYVLADPAGGSLGEGEVMRDMVREAFPGEEGRERVRRWIQGIALVEPLAPAGESFTEADLRAPHPPR